MDINIRKQNSDKEHVTSDMEQETENWDMPVSRNGEQDSNSKVSKFKDARQKVQEVIVPIGIPTMLNYWSAISRWALIAFAGLTPIFFLPFTSLPVAAHKEMLVVFLVLISFFAFLGKILVEGKVRYPGHWLMAALVVLVLAWSFSAVFSLNPLASLVGNWSTPDSLVSIISFSLVMIGVVMTFNRHDIVLSLLIFLASLTVLGVFELLQLTKFFILPFSWAQNAVFNPVGSVNDLGVLLAFGLIIASGLMSSQDVPKLLKRLLGVTVLILIVNLIIIDFWAIWVGLALAMVFLISFLSAGLALQSRFASAGLAKSEFRSPTSGTPEVGLRNTSDFVPGLQLVYFQKAWLPSLVLLMALLFIFIPSPLARFIQTPAEVSPNFRSTLNIAQENFKAGNYLLGSGPNTFGYIYNLYKPVSINQTVFWAATFNAGASAMTTWAGTVGVLGVLSLIFLIAAFVYTGIAGTHIRNESKGIMNVASQAIFVAVVFLFIMWFLYAGNFTNLAFAFWGMGLFLASSLFFIKEQPSFAPQSGATEGKSIFKELLIFTSPPKTFLFSLLIVGLMVGAVAGIYFESNRYIAEIYFGKAVKVSARLDNTGTINNISKAIEFWSYDERYFSSLSQAIFGELNILLSRKDLSQDELRASFQNITTNALAAARKAQELNSKNPANSALLGNMYENLTPFIGDAVNFAVSSYAMAAVLDPKNPSHQLALARVAIISKNLDKAATHLEEAIKLKNDYAPARFLLVQVFDNQGKLLDAIKRAEELAAFNINDIGVLFQLGFLYYKNSDLEKSRQVFERTVELSSNYSNARYFLGLIYDKDGDKAKAIGQFEKISALNPDNTEVKQIIANLKAKKAALFGIAPPAPQNRAEAPVSEGKTPVQKLKK